MKGGRVDHRFDWRKIQVSPSTDKLLQKFID